MTKDEALKLALETAEGIFNSDWRKWEELASPEEFERWVKSRAWHMVTTIREALAQPEFVLNGIDCSCGKKWRVVNNTLTASEQPEQESDDLTAAYLSGVYDGKNKYAPQRKPLTDEEIAKAWAQSKGDILMRLKPFARAIEAAHGIKGE